MLEISPDSYLTQNPEIWGETHQTHKVRSIGSLTILLQFRFKKSSFKGIFSEKWEHFGSGRTNCPLVN